ncbi:MAG: HNH endonuclease, partial [Actinomycetota bacterium]|nr:HNH endonuclease [Actinomycetota bacterium]
FVRGVRALGRREFPRFFPINLSSCSEIERFVSHPLFIIIVVMDLSHVEQAVELLEKANAELQPELLPAAAADELLAAYARAEKLAGYGVAVLAAKRDDATRLARITGTSIGRAKAVVATGQALPASGELTSALQQGDISVDQASEIAAAEESSPGAATELLRVAKKESFHVLKDQARQVKLEAEQHHDLFTRQRAARCARSYSDELGMVHIHVALQPHVAVPITARAEAEAARLAKRARGSEARESESFEQHLADAYALLLSGTGKGPSRRPELVVLVSHEVATRGWKDVREGELCKIPGVGPVPPSVAKRIAQDAFLSGVFYDGKDLRHFVRWTRNIPVEVLVALELGEPPAFDGVSCADCGNRFRTEFDHVRPRFRRGPTSKPNLEPRCWRCHQAKTKRDLRAGKLKPPEP